MHGRICLSIGHDPLAGSFVSSLAVQTVDAGELVADLSIESVGERGGISPELRSTVYQTITSGISSGIGALLPNSALQVLVQRLEIDPRASDRFLDFCLEGHKRLVELGACALGNLRQRPRAPGVKHAALRKKIHVPAGGPSAAGSTRQARHVAALVDDLVTGSTLLDLQFTVDDPPEESGPTGAGPTPREPNWVASSSGSDEELVPNVRDLIQVLLQAADHLPPRLRT